MKKKDTIPLLGSIDPQGIDGYLIGGGTFSRNAMAEKYTDGRTYTTQRPGIDIVSPQASTFAFGASKGRGIYYWAKNSVLVVVIGNKIYNGSGGEIGTITDGIDPVWIGELGDYLTILDSQNNQGWTLNGALTLVEITDPDFPGELAGGGAVLNGVLYVLSKNGTVHNSAFQDPTVWAALDFINAEREPDGGVYITKFLDQIVVFGGYTIEFLYDAANPIGSPLSRREDLSYRIGAYDWRTIYNSGDIVYFLAADISGAVKLMALNNFQLEYLSTPPIDRYLEERLRIGGLDCIMSGAHTSGHLFVFLTLVIPQDGVYLVQETLTYDATTKLFTEFETDYPGIDFFPVVGWTIRQIDSVEFSFGLMVTGDVFRFSGSTEPIDGLVVEGYVVDGYIEQQQDYVFQEQGMSAYPIDMIIRTELWDASSLGPYSQHNKFIHKLEVPGARIADFSDDGIPMYMSWTDDEYQTYSTPRAIVVGKKQRLAACGFTERRAFNLTYQGTNKLRIEDLDITFGVSSYA